jgi:hypothetical protein
MDRAALEQALRSALQAVEAERVARSASVWGPHVVTLKAFQQGRFRLTYADLLSQARWRPACVFFLEELYGPRDYADRDRAFARVVPALVRIFPTEVIVTVEMLLRLHAVSERLDSRMAEALVNQTKPDEHPYWHGVSYQAAWREVAEEPERRWQVDSVDGLGQSLDRLVRQPGLRQALRMMRAPARLAGLQALQRFLEQGFDTFHAMGGAAEFLQTVKARETLWLDWLFAVEGAPGRVDATQGHPAWLGHFPE